MGPPAHKKVNGVAKGAGAKTRTTSAAEPLELPACFLACPSERRS